MLSSSKIQAESLRAMLAQQAGVNSELPQLEKSLEELEADTALLASKQHLPRRKVEGWVQSSRLIQPEDVEMSTAQSAAEASHLLAGAIDATSLRRQIRELGIRADYASMYDDVLNASTGSPTATIFAASSSIAENDEFEAVLTARGEEVILTAVEAGIDEAWRASQATVSALEYADWEEAKKRTFQDAGLLQAVHEEQLDDGTSTVDNKQKTKKKLDTEAQEAGNIISTLCTCARGMKDMAICTEFGTRAERQHKASVQCWRLLYALAREGKRFRELPGAEKSRAVQRLGNDVSGPSWAAATRGATRRMITYDASAPQKQLRAEIWLRKAGRHFLEWQYKNVVEARLKADGDILRAHVMERYAEADDAAKFVAWQRSRHQLPAPSIDPRRPRLEGEPLWPQLYVALRCGQLRPGANICKAAQHELTVGSMSIMGTSRRLGQGLGLLAEALEARAEYDEALEIEGWLASASVPPEVIALASAELQAKAEILAEAIDQAAAAVEGLRLASSQPSSMQSNIDDSSLLDPYEVAVLDLILQGSAPFRQPAEAAIAARAHDTLARTAEDFVWRELYRSSASPNLEQNTKQLASTIQAWGPRHFDPDGRQPFRYANYLLLAGKTLAACGYLSNDAPRDALHIAIALDAYSLLQTDNDQMKHQTTEFCLETAVSAYAQHLAQADPALALEYVAWLYLRENYGTDNIQLEQKLLGALQTYDPKRRHPVAFSEEERFSAFAGVVVSLILDTRALDALCGTLDPVTAERSGGALSQHFPNRTVVDSILALAARVAQVHGDPQDAVDLFALAGKRWWPLVVDVFIDQLALLAAKHQSSTGTKTAENNEQSLQKQQLSSAELRKAWLEKATKLAANASVRDQLLRHVPRAAGHTFQLLLNMAAFFR
uniref:Nuclear pore protein n=1 Tax=Aureoumbra lagunensis TaxID=44058 RepID=A0A7S3JVR4_9STRA